MGAPSSRQFITDYFDTSISREFFDTFCGDAIAAGVGRIVYQHALDKTLVIKFEYAARSFQNSIEWDLWKQHWHAKTSTCKFLAPCVSISHSGNVLIQKKTKPIPFDFKLPTYIPAILNSDAKRDNWGLYQGRAVCHDYGRHDAVTEASKGKNMAKAEWLGAGNGHFKPCYGDRGATGLVI